MNKVAVSISVAKNTFIFLYTFFLTAVLCNKGPEPPLHGKALAVKSVYYYSESVNVVCDFGYMLENAFFATCQSNGNWTYSSTPTCKSKYEHVIVVFNLKYVMGFQCFTCLFSHFLNFPVLFQVLTNLLSNHHHHVPCL